MSNTNTVPSVKQYLKDKGLSEVISESDLIEFTKLHLEAMKDEKHIESFLGRYSAYNDDRGDRVFYDYHVTQLVIGLITDYIKNNKL